MSVIALRKKYYARLCDEIIRTRVNKGKEYPNFADGSNPRSVKIADGIVKRLGYKKNFESLAGQTIGDRFELATMTFLKEAIKLLLHLRPGDWRYTIQGKISDFYQYEHLAYLSDLVNQDKVLSAALGGNYIVKPDIVIGRMPVSDKTLNRNAKVIEKKDSIATLTPLRKANDKISRPSLHASISCKWTIRSDRAQNTRTEALNLIRNRKGKLPHIAAVTAEPLPTRIAALALGTGDLDCVYHFALYELKSAIEEIKNEDQLEILNMMIEGRRLRDISDLPFDLII